MNIGKNTTILLAMVLALFMACSFSGPKDPEDELIPDLGMKESQTKADYYPPNRRTSDQM